MSASSLIGKSASNVVENNSFNSVTLLLLITDIECDIKSLELANDTVI